MYELAHTRQPSGRRHHPAQHQRAISRSSPTASSQRGLTDALAAKGPFTVFAPTVEAFRKLPSGAHESLLKNSAKFKAVLNYHIVSGYLLAKDVKPGEIMTLQGSTLTAVVSSADVRVNGARITQADIAATNGIVHAIDTVILPKNWQLLAVAA